MARINKKVILDYFGSFFKQYSPIPKELFSKIRALVDEAECGCCSVVNIYWNSTDPSLATPENIQIIFKDDLDVELASTSLTGASNQRLCVPRNATQLCVNVVELIPDDGSYFITSPNGPTYTFAGLVDENCFNIIGEIDNTYIVTTAPAP